MNAYILLDRSGSMATNWDETLGAVNGYVDALAKDEKTGKSRVTVALFDGNDPFEVVREAVKASKWTDVTDADATPRGMTPLYDAIGSLVTMIEKDAPKKASVIIVTDGDENASRELDKNAAKARLDTMRKAGYDVVFLGADFDNMAQGAGLGNAREQTLVMESGALKGGMAMMADRAATYAKTGKIKAFSENDRAAARRKD